MVEITLATIAALLVAAVFIVVDVFMLAQDAVSAILVRLRRFWRRRGS